MTTNFLLIKLLLTKKKKIMYKILEKNLSNKLFIPRQQNPESRILQNPQTERKVSHKNFCFVISQAMLGIKAVILKLCAAAQYCAVRILKMCQKIYRNKGYI